MQENQRQRAKLTKLYKLELEPIVIQHILSGNHVTGEYDSLPLEQLLVLDEMAQKLPGLRFVLRKQRGDKYLLTVLQTEHLDKTREEIKGEP